MNKQTPFIPRPRQAFGNRCVMPHKTALEVEAALIAELQAARRRGDSREILRIRRQLARLLD